MKFVVPDSALDQSW